MAKNPDTNLDDLIKTGDVYAAWNFALWEIGVAVGVIERGAEEVDIDSMDGMLTRAIELIEKGRYWEQEGY